jgi:DnaJ family protein C protein 13
MGITTYNPVSLDVTNQWLYSDFISVLPLLKGSQRNEFRITFKKDYKSDSMTFSCDHRADLLTDALRFRPLFAEKTKETLVSIAGGVAITAYMEDQPAGVHLIYF